MLSYACGTQSYNHVNIINGLVHGGCCVSVCTQSIMPVNGRAAAVRDILKKIDAKKGGILRQELKNALADSCGSRFVVPVFEHTKQVCYCLHLCSHTRPP